VFRTIPPTSTHHFNELAKEARVVKTFIEVTMTRWVPPVETNQYKMNEKSPHTEMHDHNCTIQNVSSLIETETFTAIPYIADPPHLTDVSGEHNASTFKVKNWPIRSR
jgi:hypothetical protein